MKPLTTIKIYSRDVMDPSILIPVHAIELDSIGEVTIILNRDAMGAIRIDAAPEIKPNTQFTEIIDEATKTLSELHAKLGEVHIATNHALTDMFAVHKCLTG